jgi:hypothetical protein
LVVNLLDQPAAVVNRPAGGVAVAAPLQVEVLKIGVCAFEPPITLATPTDPRHGFLLRLACDRWRRPHESHDTAQRQASILMMFLPNVYP